MSHTHRDKTDEWDLRDGGLRPPTPTAEDGSLDKDRWFVDPPRGSGYVGMYCDSEAVAKEVAATYPPHTRIVDIKRSPDSKAAKDLAAYNTILNSSSSKETASHDPVNHPSHYISHPSGIECIQITRHMNFNLGNAIKYIWRAGSKGSELQDLEKAKWYLSDEIERIKSLAR